MTTIEANVWYTIVNCLPKKLIYFCALTVMVYATGGKYGTTSVPELTGMEALKRYDRDIVGCK